MSSNHSPTPPSQIVDLTGLPELVVHEVKRLVHDARCKQAEEATLSGSGTGGERLPLIGRLAHLGLKTPTLEEFEQARREAWASFPREFPDPNKR